MAGHVLSRVTLDRSMYRVGLGISAFRFSRTVLALLVVLARACVGRLSRLGFPATVKVEYT